MEKKLDCFEHNHIFCFKCASIVVLLCTAIWWQIERRGGPLVSGCGTLDRVVAFDAGGPGFESAAILI